MKKKTREFRFKATEIRADQKDGKSSISGYAAVFNTLSEEMGGWFGFRERIMPGAFKRALDEKQDVRALINHDPNKVLGRTSSNTLTLEEDQKGLKFRCDMPNTSYATDLMESIRRGDISQCSFGFVVRKQTWIENKDEPVIREINDLDLFDVSPVTYPAYTDTTVAARAMFPDGLPSEVREHVKKEKRGPGGDEDTCQCSCSECMNGNCEGCNMEGCDDENCADNGCPMQEADRASKRRHKRAEIRAGKRKTKTVSGKKLTSDKFAYVGDENDTSTWKLPIHDANHVRNALARFNQTKGIPEGEKDKVWRKILAAAKKFGIKVSEEQNSLRCVPLENRATDPDNDGDDDQDLIDCLINVRDDAEDFVECAQDALDEVNDGDQEKPLLEEALAEARELQGLLADFIEEAEAELAEPESEEDKEKERMRMRLEIAKRD